MMPNPLDYDYYCLGVSGGKDSTAVLLWLIYESGWPIGRTIVTNCETDNEDSLTYSYLAMLAERVYPIRYLYPACGGFYDLAKKERRFPSRKARFCTRQLKIIPSLEFVLNLKKHGRVLLLSGIRRDEGHISNNRGDLEPFSYDETYSCDKFLPVYDWSLSDVWDCHRRHLDLTDVTFLVEDDADLTLAHKSLLIRKMGVHGIPRNPLYDMGARRVGCFPCINSAKREIRALAKFRPQRIDFLESQEESLGRESNDMFSSFFARNVIPLSHRSREIVTASGEKMRVATIRDVVRWSKTKRGGKQFEFDFSDTVPLHCDARGMCE